MQRFILLVAVVCLFPSLALARTWTNREGKEIVADFVDATEEKVTLKMAGGKVVTFNLEKLCDDDQHFVRGILARRGGKKPAASSEEPGSPFETVESPVKPASRDLKSVVEPKSTEKVEGLGTMRDVDETKKKTKPENREWTDAFGNKSSGKFIRLQGNSVLVLRSGRQVALDYWQLSEADKDYLKELGEANGWAHLIPKDNPAERRNNAPGGNLAGNPGFNSGPAPGVSSTPPPGAFSGPAPGVSSPAPGVSSPAPGVSSPAPATGVSSSPPPGISDPEDLAKRLREIEEKNRSTTYSPPPSASAGSSTLPPGGSSYTPPPSASASYGTSSPGPSSSGTSPLPGMSSTPPGSSFTSPGVGPPPGASTAGPSMPGSAMPSSTFPSMNEPSFGPSMVMEKVCGSCGKTVPSNITAGGSCPHCGVYFSHDDTNGKRANPGIFGGGGGGPSRGAIKGIIVLVVLGIKGIAFMVWRSQQGSG